MAGSLFEINQTSSLSTITLVDRGGDTVLNEAERVVKSFFVSTKTQHLVVTEIRVTLSLSLRWCHVDVTQL